MLVGELGVGTFEAALGSRVIELSELVSGTSIGEMASDPMSKQLAPA